MHRKMCIVAQFSVQTLTLEGLLSNSNSLDDLINDPS